MKKLFPKWMYHKFLEPKIAQDSSAANELNKLGYDLYEIIFCAKPIEVASPHVCKPGETYHEHQEGWESKEEKAQKPVDPCAACGVLSGHGPDCDAHLDGDEVPAAVPEVSEAQPAEVPASVVAVDEVVSDRPLVPEPVSLPPKGKKGKGKNRSAA